MRVAVLGVGFVGSAVSRYYKQSHDVIEYDPPKGIGTTADLERADVAFICVPTPFTKSGFDDSYVRAAVASVPGHKTVVIKSTVLPGTTTKMQAEFPHHRVMFNPEFLRERCAYQDFVDPDRQVVGVVDKAHLPDADIVMASLPKAPVQAITTAAVAEMVKYFGNCFLSLRVAFGNQMFDLCKATHVDYDKVKHLAEADPRIGHGYLDVATDGYRGYGGTCFPKDMRALIQIGRSAGAAMTILESAEDYNNALLDVQGVKTWAI